MIDTIAFKIPISEDIIIAIKQSFFYRVRKEYFNWGEFELTYDVCATEFKPSWDRSINFKIDEIKNTLDFSSGFSITKFAYNHNCYMLYDFKKALNLFRDKLELAFNIELPFIDDWLLTRIDVCYNFELSDNREVSKVIDYFKTFEYPRKKPHIYKDSIYFASRAYTFKIYNKRAEVWKHDYKLIKRLNEKEARRVLKLSENILRLEVEIRKVSLQNYFNKNIIKVKDIQPGFFYERLNFYLSKFLGLGGKNMSDLRVYDNLFSRYNKTKAADLYVFWTALIKNKSMIKRLYGKDKYYRNIRALKKAEISLVAIETREKLDLSIPNIKCSNVFDLWDKKPIDFQVCNL